MADMWVLFGVAFAVLMAMDLPWVIVNKKIGLYKGHVRGKVIHPAAVAAIWLVILLSEALLLSYIVSTAKRWWAAMLAGSFAGFVVYFTFNGTALVTFDTWPIHVAAADTLWGCALLGTAAAVSFAVTQKLKLSKTKTKKLDYQLFTDLTP